MSEVLELFTAVFLAIAGTAAFATLLYLYGEKTDAVLRDRWVAYGAFTLRVAMWAAAAAVLTWMASNLSHNAWVDRLRRDRLFLEKGKEIAEKKRNESERARERIRAKLGTGRDRDGDA